LTLLTPVVPAGGTSWQTTQFDSTNIDYYMRRTSHGSTLSRIVHSWVLARFDRRQSWEMFNLGLKSDVADVQGGTTAEGIHLGAMVGTLDVMQRCYGGVEIRNGEVLIRPWLPEGLRELRFPVFYRRQRVDVRVAGDAVGVRVGTGGTEPVRLRLGDRLVELPPGGEFEAPLPPDNPG
jgi:alpha,alpha-trehalase